MTRTFFQDFTKDNGMPITVEYSLVSVGEPYADLPGHICDGGGSGPEIEIVTSWPRNEEYDRLVQRKMDLETTPFGKPRSLLMMNGDDLHQLRDLDASIAKGDKAAELTDVERERMESWLCEHHVVEYDEEDYF